MPKEITTTENTFLVTWTVEPGEAGSRLDHFLKSKYRKLSREYLQAAVKEGRVTLNHSVSKPSRLLKENDKVYVLSVRKEEPPVDFNFKVLYEDETLLIVDKPGNLPVHPSGRYFFNTLLSQLRVVNTNEVDQTKDFFLVHRIDRETSGVLAIGKTSEAAADLVDQFYTRKTDKEYLAIARGNIKEDHFVVDVPLGKDPHSQIKLKMRAVEMGKDNKPLYLPESEVMSARTEFKVIERKKNYTLVACHPHTGRQHQIRAHLDHVGNPIAGDKLYGQKDEVFLEGIGRPCSLEVEPGKFLSRHALHAHKLSLAHPGTKKTMSFSSPLPEELEKFWQSVD